ncbi:TonB-dependent receptor family protein [Flavobacterium sedimenticola]|uniref:TonB-dependent receptor n=1 Tax=Flavobacterium sedimenticola TaxID=3043286 RepID=A0ABT6XMG1_9FLAO|nr:TonB-dependent receptor [Flavobacterium sedimenticola]MDI9256203.1 TonB-dependent receptor [Flavobacterium sedimenticola]
MRRLSFLLVTLLATYSVKAQDQFEPEDNDTIKRLAPVVIIPKQQSPERMPETKDNILFSGKKNEVLQLSNINGNLTNNNAREIFARIPGVTVWENDGSGIQINVGVRGLSPNRSWELNTRQNGYDISSDVFGYPEAYYNPPLEAVETISLVRGGASLQFGPQFGGTLNYILKRENQKKFSFETQNTVGSYGLMSSYNAIGGKYQKFSYYVYNHSRSGDGWRENSEYTVRNTHAFVQYRFTENTKLSAEYTNMDYQMQQAGGLTDEQFDNNPRQSLRERNWFGTPWNLFSIHLDTKISDRFTSDTKFFGLIGERNSVGFTAAPNVEDAINPTTNDYANRRVDRDYYKNFGLENRNILKYKLGKMDNNLAFGVRLYKANTERKQEGKGTTGSDFDLSIEGEFARDLDFTTENVAFFAENQFKVTEKFSVTPGVRYEYINSEAEGRFGISGGSEVALPNKTISRTQPLFGLGLEYKFRTTNIYANITQAYRPVLFSDLTPPAVTDVIDPNLKDADGYNADLGFRGTYKNYLNFDFSLFYLSYNNRIGGVRQFVNNDPTQGTYIYRTNLGETVNKGIEGFFNVNVTRLLEVEKPYGNLDLFASVSFIDSRYTDFKVYTATGSAPNVTITESNLSGNRVENAPRYIHNFGLSWGNNNLSATVQYRMSGKIFTDANNTKAASANGLTGLLEEYQVFDFSAEYKFLKNYNLRAGINNLFDEEYATRRAGGYPGPGILPGDGRTFYISVGAKL